MSVFVRSTLFNLYFYFSTTFTSIFCSTFLRYSKRETVVRFLACWAKTNLWVLKKIAKISIKVEGLENIKTKTPLIIASKHQSTLDTFIFHALCDDPAYVMKEELFRIPFYGACAKKVGMIGINRSEKVESLKKLAKGVSGALKRSQTVIIFPEGTRVPLERKSPYKHGVYLLYHKTKAAVVPVALDSGKAWGRNTWIRHPGTINVAILPPIPAGLNKEAFMSTLSAVIENKCDNFNTRPY